MKKILRGFKFQVASFNWIQSFFYKFLGFHYRNRFLSGLEPVKPK